MFRFLFDRKPTEHSKPHEHAEAIRAISFTSRGTGRTFHAFDDCSASIKVWLPDRIESLLNELAFVQECSNNEIARALLFIHLYGLSDYEAMRLQQKGWFKPRPLKNAAMALVSTAKFSRSSTNAYPELGKNIHAFRLWLPKDMRQDLQKVAVDNGKLLSPYVREFLIRQLLGETYQRDAGEWVAPQGSADAEKE